MSEPINSDETDRRIREFRQEWLDGKCPDLTEFLPDKDSDSFDSASVELVLIDIEFRWNHRSAGMQTISIEEYLEFAPNLDSPNRLRQLIEHERTTRESIGDSVDWEHYLRRFPDLLETGDDLAETLNVANPPAGSGTPPKSKTPKDRVDAGPVLEGSVLEGPGSVIGNYKLLQSIGEGGFGTVYMAEQSEPVRRRVALKVIKPGMDTRQVIARFEAERQALALMEHENIARVYDAGHTDSGRPFFVMELVRGVPITEFCDANKLNTRGRLDLFIEICRAVQHAHQKGIIHRDLKPSNVLVTLQDSKPVPKVIDFGIAKATQQPLTEKTLFTQYGQVVGTPQYMSPEQAQMTTLDVDTRSDVYSLGVMLYELLTGSTPIRVKQFRHVAFDEIMRLIRELDPPLPSVRISQSGEGIAEISANRQAQPQKLSPIVRGDLDWIVMKALDKDRTRRYDSPNAMADDILRHLEHEPVLAGPPSGIYRLKKFVAKRKKSVATASAFLFVLIATTAFSIYQAVVATNERDQKDKALYQRGIALDNEKAANELAKKRLTETQHARDQAEQQTRLSESLRLSLISQEISVDSPVTGMMLAARSVEEMHNAGDSVVPSSVENLLEQLSHIGGTPIKTGRATSYDPSANLSENPRLGLWPERIVGDHRWLLTTEHDGPIMFVDLQAPDDINRHLVVRTVEQARQLQMSRPKRGKWQIISDRWFVTEEVQPNGLCVFDLLSRNPKETSYTIEDHELLLDPLTWTTGIENNASIGPDAILTVTRILRSDSLNTGIESREFGVDDEFTFELHRHYLGTTKTESMIKFDSLAELSRSRDHQSLFVQDRVKEKGVLFNLSAEPIAKTETPFPTSGNQAYFTDNGRWLSLTKDAFNSRTRKIIAVDNPSTEFELACPESHDTPKRWVESNDGQLLIATNVPFGTHITAPPITGRPTTTTPKTHPWFQAWDITKDDPTKSVIDFEIDELESNFVELRFDSKRRWMVVADQTGNSRLFDLAKLADDQKGIAFNQHLSESFRKSGVIFDRESRYMVVPTSESEVSILDLREADIGASQRVIGNAIADDSARSDSKIINTVFPLVSPDGRYLALDLGSIIGIFDFDKNVERVAEISMTSSPPNQNAERTFRFSEEGKWFYSFESRKSRGTRFPGVTLWSTNDWNPTRIALHTSGDTPRFSPNERWIVEPGIRLSEYDNTLLVYQSSIRDNAIQFSGDKNNALRLWDLDTNRTIQYPIELAGHDASFETLRFFDNDQQLITTDRNGASRKWSLNEKAVAVPNQLDVENAWVTDIGLLTQSKMRDGRQLLKVLDLTTRKARGSIVRQPGEEMNVELVSENGKWLISDADVAHPGFLLTAVHVDWKSETQSHHPLNGHLGPVLVERFSGDEKWLATGGDDGFVRLWSLGKNSANLEMSVRLSASIQQVEFTSDGQRLNGYDGHQVVCWDLSKPAETPSWIIDLAKDFQPNAWQSAPKFMIDSTGKWMSIANGQRVFVANMSETQPKTTLFEIPNNHESDSERSDSEHGLILLNFLPDDRLIVSWPNGKIDRWNLRENARISPSKNPGEVLADQVTERIKARLEVVPNDVRPTSDHYFKLHQKGVEKPWIVPSKKAFLTDDETWLISSEPTSTTRLWKQSEFGQSRPSDTVPGQYQSHFQNHLVTKSESHILLWNLDTEIPSKNRSELFEMIDPLQRIEVRRQNATLMVVDEGSDSPLNGPPRSAKIHRFDLSNDEISQTHEISFDGTMRYHGLSTDENFALATVNGVTTLIDFRGNSERMIKLTDFPIESTVKFGLYEVSSGDPAASWTISRDAKYFALNAEVPKAWRLSEDGEPETMSLKGLPEQSKTSLDICGD